MSGKGVLVFAETLNGEFPESSLELIGEGHRLANLSGDELFVIALGKGVAESVEVPFLYGAHCVYWSDDVRIQVYAPEFYTALLAGIARECRPSVFLFMATDIGNDLAPRVAARLRTGLVSHCDKLEVSPEGLLLQTRLCHGGKVHATYVCRQERPQMATIEPGLLKTRKLSGAVCRPEVRQIDPDVYLPRYDRVKVVGLVKADPGTVDITDADIIVAGGKGAGGIAGFDTIRKLAGLLGGAVAGSRLAVDNNCIGRERQIGQSGKAVAPRLLISCGISGASAHVAGMRESKTIIAINKDKHAPMIKRADLGVVGDLHEVLPILIRLLEETQG